VQVIEGRAMTAGKHLLLGWRVEMGSRSRVDGLELAFIHQVEALRSAGNGAPGPEH